MLGETEGCGLAKEEEHVRLRKPRPRGRRGQKLRTALSHGWDIVCPGGGL